MGFLKFLKKKEGGVSEEEDLDIPPTPPAIGDKDLGIRSLGEELPEPPELPELPELGEEPKETLMGDVEPEIPSFEPERFEEEPIKEEIPPHIEISKHKEITKPIFPKLSHYKEVLDNIEIIKDNLNNFEEASIRLDELKDIKDKKFTKWDDHFKDLQKKLDFVDKTLFGNR